MSDTELTIIRQDLAETRTGSRADGRPEGYMLPQLTMPTYVCSMCAVMAGVNGAKATPFNGDDGIVMMNENDTIDGNRHMICKEHQQPNIVIYNPTTGNCGDKLGESHWRETEDGKVVPAVMVK